MPVPVLDNQNPWCLQPLLFPAENHEANDSDMFCIESTVRNPASFLIGCFEYTYRQLCNLRSCFVFVWFVMCKSTLQQANYSKIYALELDKNKVVTLTDESVTLLSAKPFHKSQQLFPVRKTLGPAL